uniref:M-phase phosphoprotein 6 n=2 Tax=Rhabditophanes sp. KR3021 TaxID=114890 RepID=A0AC35U860_9BILA
MASLRGLKKMNKVKVCKSEGSGESMVDGVFDDEKESSNFRSSFISKVCSCKPTLYEMFKKSSCQSKKIKIDTVYNEYENTLTYKHLDNIRKPKKGSKKQIKELLVELDNLKIKDNVTDFSDDVTDITDEHTFRGPPIMVPLAKRAPKRKLQ